MSRSWTKASVVALGVFMVVMPPGLGAQGTGSADDANQVILGQRTSIQSAVLNQERPLLIYTPPRYGASSDSFPVLYLLDGAGHFHHASGITQFLAANARRIPDLIVVGIPNLSQDGRAHDLTPPLTGSDPNNQFPTAGGGSEFLRFLTEELVPWVEGRFRTQPFRVLVGHSLGGLFVIQALLEQPDAFQASISISPTLSWDNQKFVATANSVFENRPDTRGALYMTMGNEGGAMLAGAHVLTDILENMAPDSLRWQWSHMPGEDHRSIPHSSLYDGLEWVFDGWQLPELNALSMSAGGTGWLKINEHYSMLSERFGYRVRVRKDFVNQVGYSLLGQGRVDDAIRALEMNVTLYPNSANVYDSLGDAYEAACRWEEAKESYNTAFQMAQQESGSNLVAYFKANFDRMTSRIDSDAECATADPAPGDD